MEFYVLLRTKQRMIETMTFKEVLQRFRTESFTEREKGAKFEKLTKKWFQTDPPLYLGLALSVINVSVPTMEIVKKLPDF